MWLPEAPKEDTHASSSFPVTSTALLLWFLFSQPVIIPHPLCLQAAGTSFLRPGWLGRRDWEKPFGGEPHTDAHFQSGSAHSWHRILGTGCSGFKRRAACGVELGVHGPEPSKHFLLLTSPSVLWVLWAVRLARTLVPLEGWLEERSEGTGECPWFYVRIWKQPRSGIALGSPRSRMSVGTAVPGGLAKTRRAGSPSRGASRRRSQGLPAQELRVSGPGDSHTEAKVICLKPSSYDFPFLLKTL